MDLRFKSEKLADRTYRVTHVKSKRVFDCVRLSPTTSQWVSFEVKQDRREKGQFVSSDQSRKDLLNKIHAKIYYKPPAKIKRYPKLNSVNKNLKKIKPFRPVPLSKEYLTTTGNIRIRYTSSLTKEKFMMLYTADGWKCTIVGLAQQPIAVGMSSLADAEMELINYLDPGPRDKEEWAEYLRTCFQEIK